MITLRSITGRIRMFTLRLIHTHQAQLRTLMFLMTPLVERCVIFRIIVEARAAHRRIRLTLSERVIAEA